MGDRYLTPISMPAVLFHVPTLERSYEKASGEENLDPATPSLVWFWLLVMNAELVDHE